MKCANDQQLSSEIYQVNESPNIVKPVALPYVFREPPDQFVKRLLTIHPEFDLAVHRGNYLNYIANQQSVTSQIITLETRFFETPSEAFRAVLDKFTPPGNQKVYGGLLPQRIHELTVFETHTDTVASFFEQIANNSGINPSPNASRGIWRMHCGPDICWLYFSNIGRKREQHPIEIAAGKAWVAEQLLEAKRWRAQWDEELAKLGAKN